uniref:non-ribosomal peptide synthetase n=1 Tax=Xenorhabdus vietnamensis TaxID=351656 RepID=UPI00111C2AC8
MTVSHFLVELKKQGILLEIDKNNVNIKSKVFPLPADLEIQIKTRKQEILDFFSQHRKKEGYEFSLLSSAEKNLGKPISHIQRELWQIYQMKQQATSYNVPMFISVKGTLDEARFKQSVKDTYRQHDVLHGLFKEENQQILFYSRCDADWDINVLYIGVNKLQEYIDSECVREFDLKEGPLFVIQLLKIDENQQVVVLNFPHIIVDDWSVRYLWQEIVQRYHGSYLSESNTIGFIDYLNSPKLSDHQSYWKKLLTGYEPFKLHSMSSVGDDTTFTFKSTLALPEARALRELALENGVSNSCAALGIFARTIGQYIGQDDVVISTLYANRDESPFAAVLGNMTAILPIRVALTGNAYSDVLPQLQQLYQDITSSPVDIDELLVDLNLVKSGGRHPLQEVVFSWQEEQLSLENFEGTEVSKLDTNLNLGTAKYTLMLTAMIEKDNIHLHWEFDNSQISLASVKWLEQRFKALLHTWRDEVDVSAPMLTQTITSNETVISCFAKVVEQYPLKAALRRGNETVSYAQLDQDSSRVAAYLQAYGITPGMRIAVDLPHGFELAITILGIVKAGAIYVPMSENSAPARRDMMLKQAQIRHSISLNEQFLPKVTNHQFGQILEADWQGYQTVNVSGQSAIYVNFSSGTSGEPKGIECCHQGVVRLVREPDFMSLDSHTRMLCASPATFDAFTLEFWGPLLNGGQICFMQQGRLDNAELKQQIQRCGVNTAWLTSALFNTLVDIDVTAFDGLTQLLVGGDVVSPNHVHRVYQSCQDIAIINGYGPTENTTFTCCFPIPRDWSEAEVLPVGKVIKGSEVYILDKEGLPVPKGCIGEIVTTGLGLAKGYLNKDLEAGRFVTMKWQGGEVRSYHTGDQGYVDIFGRIHFIGRQDQQVKINGFRIELGEIENALNALPQVKQAVVIDRKRESHQYLAAYVVPIDSSWVDADQLVEQLSARLPEYMVPSTFTQIESVPLTINGKLDRRALPEPEWTDNNNYLAPRNALEEQLCEIWQEVLGLKRVGIHDNFFRIGGDSISAIKLTAAMRRECQIDVPLSLLFLHKTIVGLVGQLDQLTCVVIPPQDLEHYPLSFAQERMLFIERFEQGSCAYHIPYLVKLNDGTDLSVLVAAINAVVNRHPVIKSVYQTDSDGNSYQQVLDTDIPVQTTRLFDEGAWLSVVKAEITTPFDLAVEPSLRLRHYQVANQAYLLLMWHHIAVDGWSVDVFMQELSAAYQSLNESHAISLPKLDISYGDYALWQRDYLQSEVGEQQRRYWQDTLSGYETLVLPTDKPRPNHVDYTGRNCNFVLDEKLSAQLRALAREQETTLYTVLLAAFYATLSKMSGQTDIILGTPTDNRHHAQTQSLLGMFVNSLALRAQITPDLSVEELISHTHDVITQAKSHQDMPFEQLVDLLSDGRDMSRHPIFQVMFSVQNFGIHAEATEALPWTLVSFGDDLYTPAKYDLSVFLSDSQTCITGIFNFAVSLFNEASIERMVERYQHVLKAWVSDTHQRLAELDVLSEQERHTLLHTWNQTDVPYPKGKTLHELFEAQTEGNTKNRLAVIDANGSYSYEFIAINCLNLASQLLRYGIRKSLIGVLCEKSFKQVVSVISIVKAGSAYLPLYIDWPMDRIDIILKEGGVEYVFVSRDIYENKIVNTPVHTGYHWLIIDDYISSVVTDITDIDFPVVNSQDVAYVIFTSGSTGKPKGVTISHEGAVNTIHAINQRFNIDYSDKVLAISELSFDLSVYDIFGVLSAGATIVFPEQEKRISPEHWLNLINQHKITIWNTVPQLMQLLADCALSNSSHFDSLKLILMSGDWIPLTLPSQIKNINPDVITMSLGGATEGSIWSIWYQIFDVLPTWASIPYGQPMPNQKMFILNDSFLPCPVGVTGNIFIGGIGVALGYWNDTARTNLSFIEHPTLGKIYKTGDLGKWNALGYIEFEGRNDFQVKIRGFRIELGEIESALVALNGIKQAVVIDREKEGKKYLAAYIVPEPDVVLSKEQLRSLLTFTLPDYMIPASFIMIDNVPLTINGKLDRQALPVPEFVTEADYIAPINELEHKLCLIWEDVLGVARVGINDNFFRIGGDSIVGIQLVSRLRHAGFSVQVKSLFEAPTVAQLASLLSRTASQATVVAEQGRLTGQFDLLPVQQWFFDGDWASPHHWNQAFMVQLPGHITSAELASALVQLASRHDLLRTHFVRTETGYQQRYHAEISPWMAPLQCGDVSECGEHTLHQTLTEWQSDFDYCDGPLWRAGHLTGWSDGSARLFFAFHHLIIDAVSWRIIAD